MRLNTNEPATKTCDYMESRSRKSFSQTFSSLIKEFQRNGLSLLFLPISIALFFHVENSSGLEFILRIALGTVFAILLSTIRVAFEWERVPILRLGRYLCTKGPGIFFVIPFIDTPLGYADCRIRVTDFTAEKVLTKDAVPIYVDAIIFWMIWDAAKAKLEVADYQYAVPLSAKTALRDIIGKNTLTRLLSDRDGVGQELQQILDQKTNPWGITSLSIEIKDIVVPRELEDAISKEAQAEREKNARIILGTAEVEIAKQYAAAGKIYEGNSAALSLRSLNLLLETLQKEGSMILVPSDVPHLMNQGLSAAIAKNQNSKR